MCKKCGDITCFGCGNSTPSQQTPPPNLTDRDRERGGWNNQPDQEEMERLMEIARNAVDPLFKKRF